MPGFGSNLRLSRENLGYTFEEAGEELNIKSEDLESLEKEDFSGFPDRQFASAILDIYSDFLGLDLGKSTRNSARSGVMTGP